MTYVRNLSRQEQDMLIGSILQNMLIGAILVGNKELENMSCSRLKTLAYRIMFDDLVNCIRTLSCLHEYLSTENGT